MRLHTSVRPVTALALVALCMAAGARSSQPDIAPVVATWAPVAERAPAAAPTRPVDTVLITPDLPVSQRDDGAVVIAVAPLPSGADVPENVLRAYRAAEALLARTQPGCGLAWYHLAGIGQIESGHARGGQATPAGDTAPRILGPALAGGPGIAAIRDTDGGSLDGDAVWDRAVGPMQFIPSTWAGYGVDADADGTADPHNLTDAAAASGGYLCSGGMDLTDAGDLNAAIFRYNHSHAYVAAVLSWMHTYSSGATPVAPRPAGDAADVPVILAAATRPDLGRPVQRPAAVPVPRPTEAPEHVGELPAVDTPEESPVAEVPAETPEEETPAETPAEETPAAETPAENPDEDGPCGLLQNVIGELGDETVLTASCVPEWLARESTEDE